MKRATDLQMTTAGDVIRLLSNESAGVAVEELLNLSDPLEIAFVVATVMQGLRRPYAGDFVAELRDAVNSRTVDAERES